MATESQIDQVLAFLKTFQADLCEKLSQLDGGKAFIVDSWDRPEGGEGISRVIDNGNIFERGGVNFSHVFGAQLPPSATAARPELAGRSFQAMGVSIVMHPENPLIPTSHANIRLFVAEKDGEDPVWWFGGGFDLTPYYGFEEDCISWHQAALSCCQPYGSEIYGEFKKWCDDYFYLKHRQEPRGIGGLFFDDLNRWDFDTCFRFIQDVAKTYGDAYADIVSKRHSLPFTESQKSFQLYRRGRYVEFNLVFDRGTLFGLQSGGRTESILMSMPPNVCWKYNWSPQPGSEEDKLTSYYLTARDWLDTQ